MTHADRLHCGHLKTDLTFSRELKGQSQVPGAPEGGKQASSETEMGLKLRPSLCQAAGTGAALPDQGTALGVVGARQLGSGGLSRARGAG